MDKICQVVGLALVVVFLVIMLAIFPVSERVGDLRYDHPGPTVGRPTPTVVWCVYLPVVGDGWEYEVYLPLIMK